MQLRVDFENVKAEEVFFWVLKSHVNLICGVVSRDYFLFVCLLECLPNICLQTGIVVFAVTLIPYEVRV